MTDNESSEAESISHYSGISSQFIEFHRDEDSELDSSDSEVVNRCLPLLDNSDSDSDEVHRNKNSVLDCDNSNIENKHLMLDYSDSNSDKYEESTYEDVS